MSDRPDPGCFGACPGSISARYISAFVFCISCHDDGGKRRFSCVGNTNTSAVHCMRFGPYWLKASWATVNANHAASALLVKCRSRSCKAQSLKSPGAQSGKFGGQPEIASRANFTSLPAYSQRTKIATLSRAEFRAADDEYCETRMASSYSLIW